MFALRDLSFSTQIEETISNKFRNALCILGHYFDAIIYAFGAFILSVVILSRVLFLCILVHDNNRSNSFVVLI